jgi:Fis family transcriptional regulator
MSNLNKTAFTSFAARSIDVGLSYADFVRAAKTAFIQEALDRNHGNQSRAARELGMHRNTLSRTIHELGMQIEHFHGGRPRAQREEPKAESSVA